MLFSRYVALITYKKDKVAAPSIQELDQTWQFSLGIGRKILKQKKRKGMKCLFESLVCLVWGVFLG